MKNFFQKHRSKIIPVLITISIVVISLASSRPPKPVPVITTPASTPSKSNYHLPSNISPLKKLNLGSVTISPSFNLPQIPASLPYYQARLENQDYRALAGKIATYFKLAPVTKKPYTWSTKNNSIVLSLSPHTNTLTYIQNSEMNPQLYQGKFPPTTTQVMTNVSSFISRFPELQDLKVDQNSLAYYYSPPGSQEYFLSDSKKGNVIKVSLNSVILDFPVAIGSQDTPLLTLVFAQKSQLVRFDLTSKKLVSDLSPQYKNTLVADEILSRIREKDFTLVSTDLANTLLDKDPPSVTIRSASIEYRFLQDQLLLLPYLRLEGSLSYSGLSQPSPSTFLLPLIRN